MLEKGWGQGTIEGAICSAVNLDNGVRDFFEGSEYELSYGDVVLAPALFQEDFSRMCDNHVSVQMGNDRMEAMVETKLLDFNMDKSCLIVIGKPSIKKEMEARLSENPPKLVLSGFAASCPITAMYWDCGCLLMENRIVDDSSLIFNVQLNWVYQG